MTSQRITRLRLADLESAVIACEHCEAQVVLKLGTREQVPESCPSCRQPFGEILRTKLVELLNFYMSLGKPEGYPKIEIILKPEKDSN
jgi:hypothetical protein